MAKMVTEPIVGQAVYESYAPQKVGVIRAVRTVRQFGHMGKGKVVDVEWVSKKGERTISKSIESTNLCDLDALIADHKKKLKTHTDAKKRLEKILKLK